MKKTSMNYRLEKAGVKTIRPTEKHSSINNVFLEFNGKKIQRPHVGSVENACFKAFGITI